MKKLISAIAMIVGLTVSSNAMSIQLTESYDIVDCVPDSKIKSAAYDNANDRYFVLTEDNEVTTCEMNPPNDLTYGAVDSIEHKGNKLVDVTVYKGNPIPIDNEGNIYMLKNNKFIKYVNIADGEKDIQFITTIGQDFLSGRGVFGSPIEAKLIGTVGANRVDFEINTMLTDDESTSVIADIFTTGKKITILRVVKNTAGKVYNTISFYKLTKTGYDFVTGFALDSKVIFEQFLKASSYDNDTRSFTLIAQDKDNTIMNLELRK